GRRVGVDPGMIVWPQIFCGASSTDSVFASDVTPERSTFDNARLGSGSLTDDEVPIRIAPPPRLVIDGTTSRILRTTLISRSSNAHCHARSSKESAVPAGG